jgi:polyhydroxyalkanoate synthesis regulator phasin
MSRRQVSRQKIRGGGEGSMMFGDPRLEWRISDVEKRSREAMSRLHEVDSLRSHVDRLERAVRELRAEVTRLRDESQTDAS